MFCRKDRNNGICAYANSLLLEFEKIVGNNGSTTIKAFRGPESNGGNFDWKSKPGMEVVPSPLLRFPRLWELGGGVLEAARAGADVIFSPSYHTCPWGTIPVVATIHDATPVTSPSLGALRNPVQKALLWNTAKFSNRCITDSECSKRDLMRIYGLPPEKVEVVYLGYDRDRFNTQPVAPDEASSVLKKYGIRAPYILHHGAIQPRKNLDRLIEAYRLFLRRRADWDVDLVLAGPLSWGYEKVVEMVQAHAGRGRIVLTGAVSPHDLPVIVKGALLCAIPSLYEGFCLPMVEAMACGVPTVASNTSCLPEVSGGVLRYFDPLFVEDIADVMETVTDDDALRASLASNGLARASQFSWERCARETLRILSSTQFPPNGNGRHL